MGSQNSTTRVTRSNKTSWQTLVKLSGRPLIPSPSPLLSLPLEIREYIYAYVLISPTVYIYARTTTPQKELKPGARRLPFKFSILTGSFTTLPPSTLSLLQTCSQINREATPLFYARNIFVISPLTAELQHYRPTRHVKRVCLYSNIATTASYSVSVDRNKLQLELRVARETFLELEELRVRLTSGRRVIMSLCSSAYAKPFRECIKALREEREAWDTMPLDSKGGGMRALRRILVINRITEEEVPGCGVKLRELGDAFGAEVWFFEGYWNAREYKEDCKIAALPPFTLDE